MKNAAHLMIYAVAGIALAVAAQYCWGVSTNLPEWRLLAGWGLMVLAIFCWQRAPRPAACGGEGDA